MDKNTKIMYIYVCITESLCCTVVINMTLYFNQISIRNKLKEKLISTKNLIQFIMWRETTDPNQTSEDTCTLLIVKMCLLINIYEKCCHQRLHEGPMSQCQKSQSLSSDFFFSFEKTTKTYFFFCLLFLAYLLGVSCFIYSITLNLHKNFSYFSDGNQASGNSKDLPQHYPTNKRQS